MFTHKRVPQHEEYELVNQVPPTQSPTDSPTRLESDFRNSTDSQLSDIFEDLENYSGLSGQKIEDFNDSPLFQSVLMRYKNEGISGRTCGIFSLVAIFLWIGSVIIYSRVNHSTIGNDLTWKTNIIQLNGENITLNEYNPNFKNITMNDWRKGKYHTFEKQIRWLTSKQSPKSKHGGGFYVLDEHDKIVVNQIGQVDKSDTLISNKQFEYGNNFFKIQDFILNPLQSIEDSEVVHIIITDTVHQWRHLSFALYWLFKPLVGTYTPIQPPRNNNKGNGLEVDALDKLHYADFSPDGKYIVFGFEHNLFIQDLATGEIQQITDDGSPNIINGKSDWIYEEEVIASNKMIWWSPSGNHFIFAKINETKVQEVDMDYYTKQNTNIGMQYQQVGESKYEGVNQYPINTQLKYPKPGTSNPILSLYIYDIANKKTEEIIDGDDNLGTEYILYYAKWIDANSFLMKQSDRTSSVLTKKLYDLDKNHVSIVSSSNVTKEYKGWVERMNPITLLDDGKYIDNVVIDNRNTLALFDSPHLVSPSKVLVDNKDWDITGEAIYDAQEKFVYFLSTVRSSMDAHLVGIDLADNYKLYNITDTKKDGIFETKFSENGQYLSLVYQGPNQPWQRLINMANVHDFIKSEEYGKSTIEEAVILNQPIVNSLANLKEINLPTVRYKEVTIGKKEDQITLNIMEILPPNFKAKNQKYPLFVYTYGGPGSQTVMKKFDIGFLQIVSARLNSIILVIDPRGTGGKGWKFESFAKNNIGYWESRDLKTIASEYIKKNKKLIDKESVALWGWSYGGFVTLKTLEYDKGEVFKYGMAVAPVTNWLFYDSIYTERYMGLPDTDPNYETSARINDFDNFKSVKRFLLVHGTGDDNVHVQNLMWLLDQLNIHNVENYDMHLFPDSDHSILYDNAGVIVYDKLYYWLQNAFRGNFDELN